MKKIDGYIGINNVWEVVELKKIDLYKNGVLHPYVEGVQLGGQTPSLAYSLNPNICLTIKGNINGIVGNLQSAAGARTGAPLAGEDDAVSERRHDPVSVVPKELPRSGK